MESFETEQEAESFAIEARRQAEGRTLTEALDRFIGHLRQRGVRLTTERTYEFRIRAMLDMDTRGAELTWKLTPRLAGELYARRVEMTKVDTHRGELASCKAFGEYGRKQGWFRVNPFADVEPIGRKACGKPQLRLDEARRFLDYAMREGTREGLACALTLCLGLRASECTDRKVRDVDDGGALFWIDYAKSRAGVRNLPIDASLRPHMAKLVQGRDPDEPLWGEGCDRQWLYYHVVRICHEANVPRVSPQGLRGGFATLQIRYGASPNAIARHMGHANIEVTRQHYFEHGAEYEAKLKAWHETLTSGAGRSQTSSQTETTNDVDPSAN